MRRQYPVQQFILIPFTPGMSQMTPEQERFQQILKAQGYSLLNFHSAEPQNLFPNNIGTEPQFFQNNLQSPQRILKVFERDAHSNIRIFYFQLLRVTFQIQTENGFNTSFMYNLIHVIFNSQFEILFTPETESQQDLYNSDQFKKFFAEFVTMVQNQESPTIEDIINAYPIMDVVFIHIFRSMLVSQGVDFDFQAKIPTNIVFSELGSLLGLNIVSINSNCWRFEDSDMFVYQHTEDQLYLAYTRNQIVTADDFALGQAAAYQSPLDQYQSPLDQYKSPLDQYSSPLDQYQSYSSSAYQTNSYNLPQQTNYSSSYQAPAYSSSSYDAVPSYNPTSSYQASSSYEPISSYNPTRSNAYQSLSDMADRHVVVEPKHDIIENSQRRQSQSNQVKQSMISVTYEFVDFTGESTAYKDHVPRRLANAQGKASQPAKSSLGAGLNQYMNKPADSLGSVSHSLYSENKKQESYKPSNIQSYMNPSALSDYKSDSVYKSAAPSYGFDSYKPAEGLGILATQAAKPLTSLSSYTPSYTSDYKPSTSLDSYNYESTYKSTYQATKPSTSPAYDLKPLASSYDPSKLYSVPQQISYQSISIQPISVKKQDQKFTGGLSIEPLASSKGYQTKFTAQTSYSTAIPAPITTQYASSSDLGDYYNDFTSDQLLSIVTEPYRSKVFQIKSRVRGWKKSGIFNKNVRQPASADYSYP